MTNENGKDPWELELSRPHSNAGKSNSDEAKRDIEQPKPDEPEKSLWELESGIDHSRVYTPNITPEIPKSQWKDYILQAAREATHISETRGQVYMLVRKWDEDNEPQAPALDLARLTEWAIETWTPHFK